MSPAAPLRGPQLGMLVGVGLAMLWSCSVNKASDQFKCTTQADCSSLRVCEQGYCVIDPTVKLDAPKQIDAAVCPAACTSCDFGTTTCSITGTGGSAVTCPTGWKCDISCGTTGACGAISCTVGQSCAIHCTAGGACGAITCETKPCTVDCSGGANACGNLTCTSGNCTATCTGSGACGNISCGSGACTTNCSGGTAACGNLTCGTGRCNATCTGSGACGTIGCLNSCKCDVACNPLLMECGAMTCPKVGNTFCTTSGNSGSACDSAFKPACSSC